MRISADSTDRSIEIDRKTLKWFSVVLDGDNELDNVTTAPGWPGLAQHSIRSRSQLPAVAQSPA
jgi:hypothetical protein